MPDPNAAIWHSLEACQRAYDRLLAARNKLHAENAAFKAEVERLKPPDWADPGGSVSMALRAMVERLTEERDHWRARVHEEYAGRFRDSGDSFELATAKADAAVGAWARAFREARGYDE